MDLKRWLQFCHINVLLLFCTSGIVLSQHQCTPGLSFPGYTVPNGDIVLEYGEDLNILCVLHNTPEFGPNPSRLLSFNRQNTTIPFEMVEIVNSTAIKLHITKPPKVTMDSYKCLFNDTLLVCMNFVTVGTKPQEVTDFNCIGYNFDNLTCSWTPPNNHVETIYNLTYSLKGRSARFGMPCPAMKYPDSNDPRMSCFWNVSTTPHYRQVHEEFYFTLTMTNEFGTNQMNKTFMHFAYVLSGPPENLTVISKTPSSIYLSWTVPLSMQGFPPGLHHRILYQCVYGEKKWHFGGLITNRTQVPKIYFNLTNLEYAHAYYDIRVSLRSAKALAHDESMWSRNASITEQTSSKVPDAPPKTDVGSFELVSFGSKIDYREAYIYWQQIPDEQKNGPYFKYEVKVEGNDSIKPTEITNAYAKFVNLSIGESYTFNIWSVNSEGRSLHKSTVKVPKVNKRIKEPRSFTKMGYEYGDGRYELTWDHPELSSGQYITNYTIFWCSNERDRPYQCTGKLNWTVVPNDTVSYNGSVPNDKLYQFAISANTDNGSSGMLWASCTVIHNKIMGKLKNVWINRVGPTFIEVGWKLDCFNRIGVVEGFIIYYCPIKSPTQTECKGSQKNITIYGDSNVLSGNITHLQPYTTYMLTVAVISKHTTYSQQSDALYNTTLEEAPSSPPQNVTITNVSNSSISLAWKPPTAINGILKYYVVQYNNIEQKIEQTNVTLTNLDSFQNYLISVSACTVRCSSKSKLLNVTTLMDYPGRIRKPTVDRRNDTTITIVWGRPSNPNGLNDYYMVQFKQKHARENKTLEFNVTDRKYVIENCGDGGKFNTFYVSVKAVNIINNRSYQGPWSEELENYCDTPINYIVYVLAVVVVAFTVGMVILINRLYKHYKIMRDVEVKLPPGLAPVVTDHTLVPWNTESHHRENRDSYAPPDEELLLNKLSEGRHLSGDSSGCSSGHESVTSSLESGTHISGSSDQTEPIEKSSGYVVAGIKNCSGFSSGHESVTSSLESGTHISNSSDQTEPIEKSSGYVVAGIKNCSGYIPFNQTETIIAGIKNCKLD